MDFISSLKKEEARKIYYILDMLKMQERVSSKFVKYLRDELYEIRAENTEETYSGFSLFLTMAISSSCSTDFRKKHKKRRLLKLKRR